MCVFVCVSVYMCVSYRFYKEQSSCVHACNWTKPFVSRRTVCVTRTQCVGEVCVLVDVE